MKIAILGCGWLGLPLAQSLMKNAHQINGSTTTNDKLQVLASNQINPFLISLSENEIHGDINFFLENQEVLIIDIPPKLRTAETENFVKKIQNLILKIEQSQITKVIFVSSISVYDENAGIVTHESIPKPDSISGKQLLETEKMLLQNKKFQTNIIRFGGLVGQDRHPIKMLAGRENLPNPDSPINLIHLQDCICFIEKVIQKNSWSHVFNAVSPHHPNKKSYYTQKAMALNLPIPIFTENNIATGKIINCDFEMNFLDFAFQIIEEI
jgi:nucleoside-diphosphate-sugar epimerase